MATLSEPNWYFETYVEPAYRDFVEQPMARHRAVCAAVALHHFWERLEKFYRQEGRREYPRGSAFQQMLENECRDLVVIRRVAEAVKHQLVVKRGGEEFVATEVTKVGEDALIVENDGRPVLEVLASGMQFYRGWLAGHP